MAVGPAARRLALLTSLVAGTKLVCGYELWHAIDVQAVVCDPLPPPTSLAGTGLSSWPNASSWNTFEVMIPYDHNLVLDMPHIITFQRTDPRKTSIEFKVTDGAGKVVLPEEAVELADLSSGTKAIGDFSNCSCSGKNTGVPSSYGANYGTSCSAWEEDKCLEFWPNANMGDWCCMSWCYVDAGDCPGVIRSELSEDLFFSYQACEPANPTPAPANAPVCKWSADDPCECKNKTASLGAYDAARFGYNYGSSCFAWDFTNCGDMYEPHIMDTWCCENWCWVDEDCTTATPSEVWPGLYWSSPKCPDDRVKVSTCPWQVSDGVKPADAAAASADSTCACMGYSPPLIQSARRRRRYNGAASVEISSEYGAWCDAWDKDNCQAYFPMIADTADIWCCRSWCYVDEECPTAQDSLILPGYFWSYQACPDDGATLTSCAFSDVCKPMASQPSGTALYNRAQDMSAVYEFITSKSMPIDYGTSCSAWDASSCEAYWSTEAYWTAADKDWCCDSWAYVNGSCPLALESSESLDEEPTLFFAYGVCADPAESSYDASTKTCKVPSRRAEEENEEAGEDDAEDGDEGLAQEDDSEQNVAIQNSSLLRGGRQLSARRRASSPRRRSSSPRRRSSSSYSPPRRRASYSRPSPPSRRRSYTPRRRAPTTPRRRAYVAPEPRRRATTSTPRRRTTSSTGAYTSTSPRRRSPAVTPSAPARRRANYDATRRRAQPPLDTGRRRSGPETGPTPPPPPIEPGRRRQSPPTRRRDTSRRREAMVPAPPPAASSPTRRRTTSATGQTFTTDRRRTATSGTSSSPVRRRALSDGTPRRRITPAAPVQTSSRRRTEDGTIRRRVVAGQTSQQPTSTVHRRRVSYGYGSSSQMMGNYNGAPGQYNYGYSGKSQKKGSTMQLAMAAGVGLAGGVALAAGGYYAYSMMSKSKWGGDQGDRSWCRNPQTGRMIRCIDCYAEFSSCADMNSCWQSSGCNYELPADTDRDDIMSSGFVPSTYEAPIKVTVTKIVGPAYTKSEVCPDTTLMGAGNWNPATSGFNAPIFLTLTEMSYLGELPPYMTSSSSGCETNTRTSCDGTCYIAASSCQNGECICHQGYCSNTGGTRCVRVSAASGAARIEAPWLVLGLLLGCVFLFPSPLRRFRI